MKKHQDRQEQRPCVLRRETDSRFSEASHPHHLRVTDLCDAGEDVCVFVWAGRWWGWWATPRKEVGLQKDCARILDGLSTDLRVSGSDKEVLPDMLVVRW